MSTKFFPTILYKMKHVGCKFGAWRASTREQASQCKIITDDVINNASESGRVVVWGRRRLAHLAGKDKSWSRLRIDVVTQVVFGTRLDSVATIFFYVSRGLYCQQSLFLYREYLLFDYTCFARRWSLPDVFPYLCLFAVCVCLFCFASFAFARCMEAAIGLFLFLSCKTVHSLPWKHC